MNGSVDLKKAMPRAIEAELKSINSPYPTSAAHVKEILYISFSGAPNRDLGQTNKRLNYLFASKLKIFGCVYINHSPIYFKVIKVVDDRCSELNDRNFSLDETRNYF